MPYAATVTETVKTFGISRSRLYELMKTGDIKAKKVLGRTLVICESVREFIDRQPSVTEG